jgi:SAM-dependent methyltransferase
MDNSRGQRDLTEVDRRRKLRRLYDGLPGALTMVTGILSGHAALGGHVIRPGQFDVRGCKSILDAGCGTGRYSYFLLRHADPDARITAFDFSPNMLKRARLTLPASRVRFCVADLTRLPYPDACFDAAVCGWVIEHLDDIRAGLGELARVLTPKGKLLLMVTEKTLLGELTGCLWGCRAFARDEVRRACEDVGFAWTRELAFSRLHQWLRFGGIVVELHRRETSHLSTDPPCLDAGLQ